MSFPVMTTRKVCPALQSTQGSTEEPPARANPRATDVPSEPQDSSSQLHTKHQSRISGNSIIPELSQRTRRALWCFILLYQLLNGLLLASMTAMYSTVDTRGSIIWFLRYNFLFSKVSVFLTSVHQYVSTGYALLAVVFTYGAFFMLWYSVRRRRFCYGPETTLRRVKNQKLHSPKNSVLLSLLGCFKKLVNVYLSFGLRGRYFIIGFFMRECIESTLQTIQAYQSSRSLSNMFVNQSYGALIFLNCFVCIALPQFYRANMTKGRLVCVLVDLTLDFAWGTIIPLVVFRPYLQMFYDFQNDKYVSVPAENVQKEVEFILVMSMSDFILSTFPFISSAANMRGVKRLLSNEKAKAVAPPDADAIATVTDGTTNPAKLNCVEQVCVGRDWHRRWCSRFFHGALLLHGVVVLIISVASLHYHSSSSSKTELYECLHPVYPWLSAKQACVGRVVKCPIAGIQGSRDEITEALLLYDETTLSNLVFVDCPSLEISLDIHRFPHLSVLTIHNSEVWQWPVEAAMTGEFFDSLQTIRIMNSTFADAPSGILEYPLPGSMEFVALTDVNMGEYIHQIGDRWKHLKYFYCDGCSLTSFPQVLDSMSGLLELSLLFNEIDVIEDRHVTRLVMLENSWVDGSPLTSFPDSLWRICGSMGELSFQNTNISAIPEWVDRIAGRNLQMYAFGTPLCMDETKNRRLDYLSCVEMLY